MFSYSYIQHKINHLYSRVKFQGPGTLKSHKWIHIQLYYNDGNSSEHLFLALSVRGQCLHNHKGPSCNKRTSLLITGALELDWQLWCPLEQCSHMLAWTTPFLSVQMLRWYTQLVFLPFMTSSSTNFHKCTISFNKKCSEQSGAEILTGSIMTLVQMLHSGMSAWALMSSTIFWQAQRDLSFAAHFCLLSRSGIGDMACVLLLRRYVLVWCSLLKEVSGLTIWSRDVTKVYCIPQVDPVAQYKMWCQYM